MPIGFAYCNSVVSLSNIYCTSVFGTYSSFASNDSFEGLLGSSSNIICQICHSPSHFVISCPIRYPPKHTSSMPTVATFFTYWSCSKPYPNSVAAAHMTPKKGILFCLTPYIGSDMVQVGNGSMLPVGHVSSLVIMHKNSCQAFYS